MLIVDLIQFEAVKKGRKATDYGALEGLKERYGRFDGMLWHREQEKEEGSSQKDEQGQIATHLPCET